MYSKAIFKTVGFCALFFLAGCSLFGDDKVHLEGERIDVLQGRPSLKPDFEPGEIKVRLPKPFDNKAWTQKGGNSLHVMQHLMTGTNLKEQWSTSFGKGDSKRDFLIAEPVVAHKVVFTIDVAGKVSAFRLEDGKEIWSRKLKPQNKDDRDVAMKGAGIAVYGKRVYATTGFGDVFALDMINGKKIWRFSAGTPIRIAPTVGKDKIFVQTIDNILMALDVETGTEVWRHRANVENTTFIGGANPAYSPELDVVIAAFNNGELRALKASTGSPLWADFIVAKKRANSLANINAVKANPVIDGNMVYAIGNNSVLAAIDLRSGERIWEREIGSNNQPWVGGNFLFVLDNNSDLLAIEKDTGKIVWNTNIPLATKIEDKVGVFVTGPVLTNNRLIVATSSGYAFAVSPYTGKILGFITLDEGTDLPPVVANGTVVFATSDAELLAYK